MESLGDLPIEVENPTRARVFTDIRVLADRYQLTAYDAAYLELAIRHRLPIAALDKSLIRAARAASVDAVRA